MDLLGKGLLGGMAHGNSSHRKCGNSFVRRFHSNFVFAAEGGNQGQPGANQESSVCQPNNGEHASAASNRSPGINARPTMNWSWLRKLWYGNVDIHRTIAKHKEITQKLDEEMFRLKATLDGEENWFRQEGHRNDRKSS